MQLALRIAISVGLLGWLGANVDWRDVPRYFESAEIPLLVGALAAITLSRLIMPAKWSILLTAKGVRMAYLKLLGIYYTANFIGQVLPATIGTDLVRLHYTSTGAGSRAVIAASIVVERLVGLLGLLAFGCAGVVVLSVGFSSSAATAAWPAALAAALLAAVSVLLTFTYSDWLLKTARRWSATGSGALLQRVWSALTSFAEACLSYLRAPRTLVAFFGWTACEVVVVIIARYLVIAAFVPEASIYYVLAFAPVVILLHRIPISFAGWGVYEAGFVYFLTQAGVETGLALVIGIVDHLLVVISVLPGAGFYLRGQRARALEGMHDG